MAQFARLLGDYDAVVALVKQVPGVTVAETSEPFDELPETPVWAQVQMGIPLEDDGETPVDEVQKAEWVVDLQCEASNNRSLYAAADAFIDLLEPSVQGYDFFEVQPDLENNKLLLQFVVRV